MKVDAASLLDGIAGNGAQEGSAAGINYGKVSISNAYPDADAAKTGAGNKIGNGIRAGMEAEERIAHAENLMQDGPISEAVYQNPAQEKKSGTVEDVMQQADSMDAVQMKDKMVVASHTMTASDCKKMEDDGFSLDQTEIETIVTVTDKIKAELAKAGADISYFVDGLSAGQLEEIMGGTALAQTLAAKMRQADLPITAENMEDCKVAVQEVTGLHTLNDGALKYMLDNRLEPTIANLYKAQYSGSAAYNSQNAGKTDFSSMQEQVSKIIAQAGLQENEQTVSDSFWLIENKIPLTADNLKNLESLKSIRLPEDAETKIETNTGKNTEKDINKNIDKNINKDLNKDLSKDMEYVLDAMITAMTEGKHPQDAALLEGYSLNDRAQHAVNAVRQVTREDIVYVVSQGKTVNLKNLEQAHQLEDAYKQEQISSFEEAQIQVQPENAEEAQIQVQPENAEEAQIQVQPENTEETQMPVQLQPDDSGKTQVQNQSQTVNLKEAQNQSQTVNIEKIPMQIPMPAQPDDSGKTQVQNQSQLVNLEEAQNQNQMRNLEQTQNQNQNQNQERSTQEAQIQNQAENIAGQTEISDDAETKTEIKSDAEPDAAQNNKDQMQISVITARRQLEEVRLLMTKDAAFHMLKQGIQVDTCSMEELIKHLKGLEDNFYRTLLTQGGIEASQANVSLFLETSEKVEQLKGMPAYALGTWDMQTAPLRELHQSGSEMQQNFNQANERYEAMQTGVRADLGDSVQKAFQNVDDVLQALDLETSAANERAVRILAYNSIEATVESITRVKAADQQVQMAFQNMTPAVVREFIARGIRPLDMDIIALNKQAEQIKTELNIDTPEEKYSEYLYKLEQNHSISKEERKAYIGIYRLMHQVAESDGAAVGALVNQGAQITMRNLLSAVRSGRHGKIDVSVDSSFGILQSGGYQSSITAQIAAGYQNQCAVQAADEISPERFRTVANETQWEDLTPEQFLQQLREAPEDMEALESYYAKKLEDLTRCSQTPEQVYQILEQYELPRTVINVLAASEWMYNRNGAFRRLFGTGNGRRADSDISTDEYMSKNADGSVDVDFDAMREELLDRFAKDAKKPEELAKAMAQLAECAEKCMSTMIIEQDASLDIRELKLMNAQISMGSKMASSECFSMPIVIDGEVTNVVLKIVRGKQQKGLINITLETSRLGKIAAEFKAMQKGISGYIAVDSGKTRDYLQSMRAEIAQAVQPDGNADLRFVVSRYLDLNYFASQSGSGEEPETEELREVQTKTLYGMAEGFIRVLHRMDV